MNDDFWGRVNELFARHWNRKPPIMGRTGKQELDAIWNVKMKHDPDDPDWAAGLTSGAPSDVEPAKECGASN